MFRSSWMGNTSHTTAKLVSTLNFSTVCTARSSPRKSGLTSTRIGLRPRPHLEFPLSCGPHALYYDTSRKRLILFLGYGDGARLGAWSVVKAAAQAANVAIVFPSVKAAIGPLSTLIANTHNSSSLSPKTIVATPVLLPWLSSIPAVILLGFPGTEGGNALASLLFDDAHANFGQIPSRSTQEPPVTR
ncbi:hypothetical protein BC936DRAFT_139539 [Jimgerdemannia flammicorona]|uniref:Uncharacterized protein n=1 Tax=Jimgerdemannia flammicorona TaxID=994334 RepID=A0A433B9P4_9FUNG|nr:hypothetical protein BC936DRAFT_139539 [Jimgerdemannia flammicorona]